MGSEYARREPARGVDRPDRDDERRCESCGGGVGAVGPDETTSGERVTRTLPVENGSGSRLVEYCSPACFIRHLADVSGTGPPGD